MNDMDVWTGDAYVDATLLVHWCKGGQDTTLMTTRKRDHRPTSDRRTK